MHEKLRIALFSLVFAGLIATAAGLAPSAFAQETGAAEVLPTDRILYCQAGTTLSLSGPCPLTQWTGEARLELDRHVVARDAGGAMDGPYSFTWTVSTAGQYVVEVTYSLSSGGRAVARRLILHVLDGPPLDWEDGPRDADNDFPVTLHRAPLTDFRVARSYVLIDGQPLPVDPLDFTATVPGAAISDGVHSAVIEAFDRAGDRYVSPPSFFGVPPRIVLTSPGSLVVRTAGATVPLRAKVSPLWKPVSITYYVNDQPVASSDQAPFLAHADLSAYDSGTYALKASAVDEAGNMTETAPVSVAIINIPRERADEVQEHHVVNAPAQSQPALVTTPAIQVLDTEGSAVVHGVSAGLTTDGTELIGVPTTVVAAMRRGTGKTDITGIPDDTALSAAGAAADWVRHLSTQARDWSQWDIVLAAKDGDAQASASPDGVTVALALYSALTGRTFDPSVMVIGNLTESGALAPVGNVISKADYALSRPEIKTVVVPNNPATAEELGVLSKMKPVIFEGKHIVYAQTMDDVLHDTLDGSWTSARPKPRRAIAAVSRPMQVTPTQAAASVPSVPLPARPHAASAVQDEDPANAELDQWQKMYDRNANAIKSFASQLLHSVGGS